MGLGLMEQTWAMILGVLIGLFSGIVYEIWVINLAFTKYLLTPVDFTVKKIFNQKKYLWKDIDRIRSKEKIVKSRRRDSFGTLRASVVLERSLNYYLHLKNNPQKGIYITNSQNKKIGILKHYRDKFNL